ncbi:MAG: tRNA (N6-isopentenyl adenosine(37)-C2)-methylthiotransferase MiaB [Clostridia bacterium]|nr:tRNA (N6-isopentenyl adenosine(37)-C2)-methylthiotransferase MiaB [Clostridia bacterium]
MPDIHLVTQQELMRQAPYEEQVRAYYRLRQKTPKACIHTFGCQQNVSDSEHIKGLLAQIGYVFTDRDEQADLILFNTCAVREHAEDRVFGNVGALKAIKRRRPSVLIAVCGCMAQQKGVAERLHAHFPFVGLVFGTHVLYRLPELLAKALQSRAPVYETPESDGVIAEDIPVVRDAGCKAWLPIMYGCNNFCTYCIVPYVRGRERSRDPQRVLQEARELVQQGYRDITLLGQNVNSYGNAEGYGVRFPQLLEEICRIPGDFIVRFMTSHPKDATEELFDTIARCSKVSRHCHLPFQSGSDRILKRMNRGYTREDYLRLIRYARQTVPGITFTSDVIVGFPGETEEDFEQTLDLVRQVGFASLYTFLFSPRPGTPAAQMEDPTSAEEKSARFQRLLRVQEEISQQQLAQMVGQQRTVLIEGRSGDYLEGRLPENKIVRLNGEDALIGKQAVVRITSAGNYLLAGEICEILS